MFCASTRQDSEPVEHPLTGKLLKVVALLVLMVYVRLSCEMNWKVLWPARAGWTLGSDPVMEPSCGDAEDVDGIWLTVMPLVAPRLSEKSDWRMVLRWKSSRRLSGVSGASAGWA